MNTTDEICIFTFFLVCNGAHDNLNHSSTVVSELQINLYGAMVYRILPYALTAVFRATMLTIDVNYSQIVYAVMSRWNSRSSLSSFVSLGGHLNDRR